MSGLFLALAALAALSVGGILVFKRIGSVEPLAWIAFGAVAFGQAGFPLRLAGPEPWVFLKFLATNIAIGLVLSLAVRKFYRVLERYGRVMR